MGSGIVRLPLERAPEMQNSLCRSARIGEDGAEIVTGFGKVRIGLQCLVKERLRFLESAWKFPQHVSEVVAGIGTIWGNRERLAVTALGIGNPSQSAVDHPKVDEIVHLRGRETMRPFHQVGGGLVVARLHRLDAALM